MIRNQEVATLLENVVEQLEARNESVFRIGAYRPAAQRITSLPEDIETVWRDGRLGRAAREHRLCRLPPMGEKLEADILREVIRVERRSQPTVLRW
jgi:DNA polymerase/3'-5' exonuclease PolX